MLQGKPPPARPHGTPQRSLPNWWPVIAISIVVALAFAMIILVGGNLVHRQERTDSMDYQWKYRVVKRSLKWAHSADTVTFSIYEVYRDENDKIVDIERQESKPEGDSAESLKADISLMMEAFSLPVIEYDQVTEQLAKKERP